MSRFPNIKRSETVHTHWKKVGSKKLQRYTHLTTSNKEKPCKGQARRQLKAKITSNITCAKQVSSCWRLWMSYDVLVNMGWGETFTYSPFRLGFPWYWGFHLHMGFLIRIIPKFKLNRHPASYDNLWIQLNNLHCQYKANMLCSWATDSNMNDIECVEYKDINVSLQVRHYVIFLLLLTFTCLSPPRISQDTLKTNWVIMLNFFPAFYESNLRVYI